MNNQEVAHKWANQSGRGNAAKGSHFYYEGPAIWSYGRHFMAGFLLPERKIALVNSRTYSPSTQRHLSYVRRALSADWDVFYVPEPNAGQWAGDHPKNLAEYLALDGVRASLMKSRREDKRADYKDVIARCVKQAKRYYKTFPVAGKGEAGRAAVKLLRLWEKRVLTGVYFAPKEQAEYLAKCKAANAEEKARDAERERVRALTQAQREEERRAEVAANLARWLKGEDVRGILHIPGEPAALRIKDKRIETTQGAQITLRAAVMLWGALTSGAVPTDMDLDGYKVNAWDGVTLRVGCHEIGADELARLAALLKLPGSLPVPPCSNARDGQTHYDRGHRIIISTEGEEEREDVICTLCCDRAKANGYTVKNA